MASSSSSLDGGLRPEAVNIAPKPLYAPPRRRTEDRVIAISHDSPLPFDEDDPSVYFDRESGAWRYELPEQARSHGDPLELEWNPSQKRWLAVVDDALIEAQQAAYSVPGVDESTPAASVLRRENKRRRHDGGGDENGKGKQRKRVNASIYVTGLPLDCTKEEIAKTFSRYGVLNEDDAGQPRIKMYMDEETGSFRGDALVTYFREESVELALNVLDESALRAAEGMTKPVMHLVRAEFGRKDGDDHAKGKAKEMQTAQEGGTSQKKAPLTEAEKKKMQKRYAKMNK